MNSFSLLASHMAGDYIFQTNYMAMNKLEDPKVRAKHVAAYTAAFIPTVLDSEMSFKKKAFFLLSLGVTHYIIDSRRWVGDVPGFPKAILVDQSLHAVQIAILRRICE